MTQSKSRWICGRASRAARLVALAQLALFGVAQLVACGGKTTSGGGTDTSTNWVESCTEQSDCDTTVLCRCGFCTLPCERNEDCKALAESAVCVAAPDNGCAEAPAICAPASGELPSTPSEPSSSSTEPEPSESMPTEPMSMDPTEPTTLEPQPSEPSVEPDLCETRTIESCEEDALCAHSNGSPYNPALNCFEATPEAVGCLDAERSCPPTVNAGLDAAGMCYSFGNCLPANFERAPDVHACNAALSQTCPTTRSAPDECRSRCELATADCPETAFDDFSTTREQWSAAELCGSTYTLVVGGQCSDGTLFLYNSTGFTSEVRYYGGAGGFMALSTTTDVVSPPCGGAGYWPEAVLCDGALVSDVWCGDTISVGTELELPWSSDPPP
jgi:hypothetical protein